MTTPVEQASATSSQRLDPSRRTVETVGFVRAGDDRLFVSNASPTAPPIGGVVVCSSLYEDFMRNYRREVLLGRQLAEAGIAVQRFHYRGCGNSEGSPAELTFDRMVEDAAIAAEHLRKGLNQSPIAFIGTRLGGLVAAAATAAHGAAPLALWEPAISPRDFFREAFMASAIRDMKRDPDARASVEPLVRSLTEDGGVDILGYTVTRRLHDDLVGRSISRELGDVPRPVLLVQIASENRSGAAFERFAAGLRQIGCSVESTAVQAEETWWFTGAEWKPEEARDATARLITITRDWLLSTLPNAVNA